MWYKKIMIVVFALSVALFPACQEDDDCPDGGGGDPMEMPEDGEELNIDFDALTHNPTAYEFNIPPYMPNIQGYIPSDKPVTVEGVALGKKLFHDPILSIDYSMACASCHNQELAFTDDGEAFSTGVDGSIGTRNAMPLFNLAYHLQGLFWDGAAASLEEQALEPVPNPHEMNLPWEDAIARLMVAEDYRILFYEALGVTTITPEDVADALAQFERTLVSTTSKYDLALTPGSGIFLNDLEDTGRELFILEATAGGADCFHCHGDPGQLFTDNTFHNNGLDTAFDCADFEDKGLGGVTGDCNDNGKFKTPSLRNIALTAPYMHDGRFATLEEVIDHYSEGIHPSATLDPIIASKFGDGEDEFGLGLNDAKKEALIAFLHTLTDTAFINNPEFREE
ncbi:MAG: cytochrome-c peroxidase [Chitinophagales bacterium]